MRNLLIFLLTACIVGGLAPAMAETNCKVCTDQQRACMKNYAGPTCKSEYQMCMKSCKK